MDNVYHVHRIYYFEWSFNQYQWALVADSYYCDYVTIILGCARLGWVLTHTWNRSRLEWLILMNHSIRETIHWSLDGFLLLFSLLSSGMSYEIFWTFNSLNWLNHVWVDGVLCDLFYNCVNLFVRVVVFLFALWYTCHNAEDLWHWTILGCNAFSLRLYDWERKLDIRNNNSMHKINHRLLRVTNSYKSDSTCITNHYSFTVGRLFIYIQSSSVSSVLKQH